ncbi:Gluconate 2-dehydrogenase subunit 3 [Halomicrobium zhouii]|uniref:Gluconate 2-dehydrogenase subunit 3 n=1 Tax=Halomicrobium zhouii TaxID=767519 RepID=A0A1I6KJL8_9EURY|nr:gluconate 2-dehydrogenase subunit 3 family protein [Halomicrobium zhouii]SFR91238.1 Gluconate 2-dehydrogenase subunit 3 [Halomicrobium zhouii]
MELTRRDAVAALAAAGVAGGGAYLATTGGDSGGESNDDEGASNEGSDAVVETATALAPVLYPAEVADAEEFVRTYVTGRIENDDDHRTGMADAVAVLDDYATEEFESNFRDLSPAEGDQLLTDLGLDRVGPDPEGSDLERVRFYLVNELLYALFSSPTGGELVGTENPPGHPGGLESYQGARR